MAENLNDTSGWSKLEIYVPPELNAIGAGPDLQRFFDAMIYKLRRNAHKGKWESVPIDAAFAALEGESDELRNAVVQGSTSEILMEAADVANQALIVASIALEAR
jgi:NTP pyrophosphatase (non-canonical NTP hydrolase)